MSGDSSLGIGIGLALKSYGRAFRGLLNQYPGAAAAYSLRKLSSSTSNVVRVRRSFDDFEQDFTAAEVSNGGLVNFANNGTSDLYNERMYFDGVNDNVTAAIPFVWDGAWDISFNFIGVDVGGSRIITDPSSTLFTLAITTATLIDLYLGGNTIGTDRVRWSVPNLNYSEKTYRFTHDGSGNFEMFINGVSQGIQSASAIGARTSTALQFSGRTPTAENLKGILSDITIDIGDTGTNDHEYQGYGNTNADWEDQIGSNDGTVNGSPALYSGQGFDGFVAKWYDQSGNGNDAVQPTTTAQPKIVDGGSLVTGGLDFDGVDDYLELANGSISLPCSTFITQKLDLVVNQAYTFGTQLSGSNGGYVLRTNTYQVLDAASPFPTITLSGASNTNEHLVYVNAVNGGKVSGAVDGGTLEQSTSNIEGWTSELYATTIGRRPDSASLYLNGKIKELIHFNSDQSTNRTGIENNINAHYNIYP